MTWKKKKRYFICVTITRNWLLHLGLNTTLGSPLQIRKKYCMFMKIATLPHSSISEIVGRAIMVRDANNLSFESPY
jgi:hypothetical protein